VITDLEATFTTAEVAESLKVSRGWIREQTKPVRDENGRTVRPPLVSPLRIGSGASAPMRFTASDVSQLREALRPTSPVVPLTGRRRRRRRT